MATRVLKKVLTDTTISAATQTDAQHLQHITGGISYQINCTSKTSPGSASIQLQGSNDSVNWMNIGSSQAIAANTTSEYFLLEDDSPSYMYSRLSFAVASNNFVANVFFQGIEEH